MRHRALGLASTLVLLVLGLTFLSAVVPFRQILAQRQQVEEARARLEALAEENRLLEAEIAALNTPVEIERLAREKLGYVFEGEVAYVVLSPPGEEPEPAPEPVAEERVRWYEALWAYLTGADVAGG